jgi:hypothetical protein
MIMLSKQAYVLVLFEALIVLVVVVAFILSRPDNFCTDTTTTGIPQEECEALVAIIDTNPNFTAWTDEYPTPISNTPCAWAGVVCENGHVWELDLSSNQLTTLPPEIGQITNLFDLYLGYNQLSELPPEISKLVSLRTLDLRDNLLTMLPPEITGLINLFWFNLDDNQLSELPQDIGRLIFLRELSLRNNQLTTLPEGIASLNRLGYTYSGMPGFNLCGNPLEIDDPQLLAFISERDEYWDQECVMPAG